MRRPAAKILLLCFASLLGAAVAPDASRAVRRQDAARSVPGQDTDERGRWQNGVTEAWWHDPEQFSEEAMAAARARWRQIGEENLAARSHAWAGDYFVGGDTHGTYMRWSPRAGFVIVSVNKCAATVMGVAHGDVAPAPTFVEFRPVFRRRFSHGAHGGTHGGDAALEAMKYLPVRWRGERLMIDEKDIGGFADYVAGLGDYNGLLAFPLDVNHFMHSLGPDEPRAAPRPLVPPGYEQFLKRPVEAVITSVGRRELATDYSCEFSSDIMSFRDHHESASLTFVTVSAGSEHGLKPGVFLRVSNPDKGENVRLTQVGKLSSTGVIVRDIDERGRETFYDHDAERESVYPKVRAGWKLTTAPSR